MRQQRRKLSLTQQKLAALKIARKISALNAFKSAKRVGFYFANDGEISPEEILKLAIKKNKQCFASALKNKQTMVFRKYLGKSAIEKHAYCFFQPRKGCAEIYPNALDLVFVPLVAFTVQGDRLGMGGGYYDRTFAFKKRSPKNPPTLVGIAHQCQQTENLSTEKWDVSMDYICTDKMLLRVEARSA